MKTFTKAVLLSGLFLAGSGANAGTVTLTNGGTNAQYAKSFSNGEVNVRASAFSIDASNKVRSAKLASWDHGLGVDNLNNDNSHTIDNSGWTDFVVFQFDKSVALTSASFQTGWHNMNDTDASIGRLTLDWAGLNLPWNTDLTSALAGQDRSILNHFNPYLSASNGNGNQTRAIGDGINVGNVWLVSAALINPDSFKDGFKLKSFDYNLPAPPGGGAVPEPATWAMLILGMGMIGGTMRRRSAATRVARASIRFA